MKSGNAYYHLLQMFMYKKNKNNFSISKISLPCIIF